MANKAGNIVGGILGGLFVAALYIGRWLGAIGVLGLLFRLIGWYKEWIWTWVIFVIIGFISAAVLEKLQKSSR
ncbi:MAG TPA: hypothetical protein VFB03_01395 [Candidatus Saccharimonadales bacterium]|nr:hypothetical protein [Candidatus Saccharimonadales bacterium]